MNKCDTLSFSILSQAFPGGEDSSDSGGCWFGDTCILNFHCTYLFAQPQQLDSN